MKRYEIVLLQGAQADLLEIYTSRGESVYTRVDKALDILKTFPEVAPLAFGTHIRRLVVMKTTLGIYFSLTGSRVLIGAILDLRQSPNSVQRRLKSI